MAEQFGTHVGDGVHGRPDRELNGRAGQRDAHQHDGRDGPDHQRPAELRNGRVKFRQHRSKPVRERTDKAPELFQKIGRWFYFCKYRAKRKSLF